MMPRKSDELAADQAVTAYLSRLPLSGREGPYAIHRKVYDAVSAASRPLWRVCDGYALILARSPGAGMPTKAFAPSPKIGQVCRFDLLAEVSAAKVVPGQDRSRRIDLVLEARNANPKRPYCDLAREVGGAWLASRASRHGFEVVSLSQTDYEVIEFVRQGQSMRIGAVRFAGTLRVTEPDRMHAALLNGIGHSKAWGCGLLLCLRS